MGFYVDVAEIKKATQNYKKKAQTVQEQLDSAKTSMNDIITSNAMQGRVGEAITADINNNQNTIIVGLKDCYKLIASEMIQTYTEFQSTTGETSESAIISEEVLNTVKKDLDKLKTTHKELEQSIKTVYNDISDLVSLSMPKSNFENVADQAKTHIDTIIKKVNSFDRAQTKGTTEDLISALKHQIALSEKVSGLSYTDPNFLKFVTSTELADNIQNLDNQITAFENEQKKLKEKELAKTHPLLAVLNGQLTWEEASKNISKDINNNWTAFFDNLEEKLFSANASWISPLLGFEYNAQNDYYYTNKHSIQSIGGFNDLFDKAGPLLGMNLDDEVIYFDANGKEYRLELWKGSYGFGNAYGAEVGLYYKNPDSTNFVTQVESAVPGWYPCVEEMDQIPMKNTIYSFDSKTPLIVNDTRDYAEDGSHFWNLAIKTDNTYTKDDLFTVTELEIENGEVRKEMVQSLRDNPNIQFIEENGNQVKFTWKK